jgi:hypothetical protein
MSKFIADTLTFNADEKTFADFFSDISNLKLIMPNEIENWKVEDEQCSFTIKNLGLLKMEKGFVNPNAEYEYISTAESKVDFTLIFRFRKETPYTLSGQFEIQSDINPLVEMMVKRPLTNFVNLLTKNLQEQLS